MRTSRAAFNLCFGLALKFARQGRGCLLLIDCPAPYSLLFGKVKRFRVAPATLPLIEHLAKKDGAVVIRHGLVVAGGAMVAVSRYLPGAGTRHASAVSAASFGGMAVLASETERTVKVFRGNKMLIFKTARPLTSQPLMRE